jgi:hypothetical protein
MQSVNYFRIILIYIYVSLLTFNVNNLVCIYKWFNSNERQI